MCAQMAMVLASDWFSWLLTGSANRWPVVAKGMVGSKPLTGKKGIVGSGNRKSRDLEGETAGECEKGIVGSRGSQTAEKSPKSNFWNGGWPIYGPYMGLIWFWYGTSPSWAAGVILEPKKRHGDVVKNSFNGRHVFNKSLNEDPRLLAIIHGMLSREEADHV